MDRAELRLVVLGGVLFVGCGPRHVDLALAPTTSVDDRIARFNAYRPIGERITITYGGRTPGGESARSLILSNGIEVEAPEDLVPVLPPQSPSARAAREAEHDRSMQHLGYLGVPAMVVSFVVFVKGNNDGNALLEVVGLTALAGSLALLGTGIYFAFEERGARRRAFALYEQGLLEELHLCLDGVTLSPCEPQPGLR